MEQKRNSNKHLASEKWTVESEIFNLCLKQYKCNCRKVDEDMLKHIDKIKEKLRDIWLKRDGLKKEKIHQTQTWLNNTKITIIRPTIPSDKTKKKPEKTAGSTTNNAKTITSMSTYHQKNHNTKAKHGGIKKFTRKLNCKNIFITNKK